MICQNKEIELVNRVMKKYSLMRIRMKISFSAFVKNETVLELWYGTIHNSVKYLRGSGQLEETVIS